MKLINLSNFNELELIFLAYLFIVNLLSLMFMGIDKSKAKNGKYRISENILMGVSICGGAMGTLLGMVVFRHKTSKKKFYIGVPLVYLFIKIIIIIIFNYIK